MPFVNSLLFNLESNFPKQIETKLLILSSLEYVQSKIIFFISFNFFSNLFIFDDWIIISLSAIKNIVFLVFSVFLISSIILGNYLSKLFEAIHPIQ